MHSDLEKLLSDNNKVCPTTARYKVFFNSFSVVGTLTEYDLTPICTPYIQIINLLIFLNTGLAIATTLKSTRYILEEASFSTHTLKEYLCAIRKF